MNTSFFSSQIVLIVVSILGWLGFITTSIVLSILGGKKRYRKSQRLGDVIRLINALALESNDFKTEDDIVQALRSKPRSAKTWHQIAEDHPEFFRLNGDFTRYALITRSYIKVVAGSPREPLTIEQTQKLCDLAVTFHDKEVQQSQSFTLWFPLIAAILASVTLIVTSFFTNFYAYKDKVPTTPGIHPKTEVTKSK